MTKILIIGVNIVNAAYFSKMLQNTMRVADSWSLLNPILKVGSFIAETLSTPQVINEMASLSLHYLTKAYVSHFYSPTISKLMAGVLLYNSSEIPQNNIAKKVLKISGGLLLASAAIDGLLYTHELYEGICFTPCTNHLRLNPEVIDMCIKDVTGSMVDANFDQNLEGYQECSFVMKKDGFIWWEKDKEDLFEKIKQRYESERALNPNRISSTPATLEQVQEFELKHTFFHKSCWQDRSHCLKDNSKETIAEFLRDYRAKDFTIKILGLNQWMHFRAYTTTEVIKEIETDLRVAEFSCKELNDKEWPWNLKEYEKKLNI